MTIDEPIDDMRIITDIITLPQLLLDMLARVFISSNFISNLNSWFSKRIECMVNRLREVHDTLCHFHEREREFFQRIW